MGGSLPLGGRDADRGSNQPVDTMSHNKEVALSGGFSVLVMVAGRISDVESNFVMDI